MSAKARRDDLPSSPPGRSGSISDGWSKSVLMAVFLVIFADAVADQIMHMRCHFTSIFVNNNDFIGNKLPMLLPIIPLGANPSEAANFHKEQTPNS
jgi:hypothetical protein